MVLKGLRPFKLPLVSDFMLSGDELFGVDSGGSPISGSGYGLPSRIAAYIASSKNAGYFGLHLVVGDDIASGV